MTNTNDPTDPAHVVAELMATLPEAPPVPAMLAAIDPAARAKRKAAPRSADAPAVIADTAVAAIATSQPITTEPATPAASPAFEPKDDTMNETINQTVDHVETVAETAVNTGEQLFAGLKDRAGTTVAKGQQLVAELNDFNKGNVAAIVESGKIAVKGLEKLGHDAADYTRRSFEQTSAAVKGLAAVKSPTDLLRMQSDYVRTSFDMMVAETSRSTESMLKLAGEIVQPISNRFAVAVDKVKQAA